jgi:hypothetical protein
MKKMVRSSFKIMVLMLFTILVNTSNAQVTLSTQIGSTGYTGGNGLTGNTGITFAIENNSGSPYYLSDLSNYFQVASNGATVRLWYSATSLSGATPSVSTTDWTVIATNPSVSVPADGIVPVFTGMTFLIPNATTYRFCIESTASIRYSGTGTGAGACTPNVFTQNGISLRVGESTIASANIGYSVTFTSGTGVLGNNPRWFTGIVNLTPATPCTAPPTAGTAVVASNLVCPGTNFDLNLSGSTVGTGLSYQWEQSSDSIAWTDITLGTTQKYTTSLTSVTYYRCKVTCSSVTTTSTAIKVSPRPTLAGGTYTLNSSLPNSSTNFNSIAQLNGAFSCGITGPIVINVQPGTYVGSLNFTNVSGTSNVNTITINGRGAKIIDTLKSGKVDYILQIRGTNYVTIDSLTLEAHSTSTKGFVVSMGAASYNTIKNSKIIGNQTDAGTTTMGGIVLSGATNSATTATTGSYNTIENNEIAGGYYGVMMYGTTTIANMKGNIIRNNVVRDYAYYGIYVYGTDSMQIVGNNLHRKTRTIVATATYSIYSAGAGQQHMVKGNKIHDIFQSGSSATFYGIYHAANDGIVGKENIVANNAIYNINTTGSQYCIYNSASDHWKYYYNTVYIDNPTATAGLCYGFYQITLATGIELKNNIFSISKGGSGAKYCIYFGTATTLPNTNYNNLYVNTTVSGTGVKNIAFHSAARVTLADWQAYQSSVYDQNSVNVEPSISGTSVDDVKPNAAALNNAGTVITSITDDINGALRSSSNPDIGAVEFTPANDDAGITSIVSPKGVCPGTAAVEVRVKNFGLSTLSSVMVNWTINGVAQTPYMYIGSVNTGADTLLGIGSFTVAANTPYNIKIWTSAPNSGIDANAVNDTVSINGLRSGLVGTVTVGGVGADFADLASVSSFLSSNGVCGATIVNVNASAGPFSTGISLQNVVGLSSTNTLTINGNGAVINTLSNGITLNKVRYVTIDSFVVNVNGVSGGLGIHIQEGNYNTIRKNRVNIGQDKTATTYSAMALSGSSSSATTAGIFKYNVIENNVFVGGYYLLSIYGNSADLTQAVGNVVRNNKLIDAYIYSCYTLGTDSTIVENNEINRATRTLNITTFYGLFSSTGTKNLRSRNNKIHSIYPVGYTGTATAYLIYTTADAPSGSENIHYNNAVYNIGGSGTVYGIYSPGSDGSWYYNNSLEIGGSGAGTVYGIYQTTAASNVQFQNNSINIQRVSGTGTRILLYYATNTSTIISNYNHLNGNAGVVYGQWGTVQGTSLAAWKTVNTAFDQNSVDGDPLFNGIRNLIPKVGSPLVAAGSPLAAVGTDLLGVTRNSATPTIGAYETAGDFSGPSISFTPILNTLSTSNYTVANFATIVDPTGVDTTLANRARLYYKLSTNADVYNDNTSATDGWKYVVATNNSSPFSFTIDYSKLNTAVAVNSQIQYFVVAQDVTGIANINAPLQLTNDASSVRLTSANFPVLGTPNVYRIANSISGTFTVGTNETYKSLTGASSIFEHINNNILSGDVNIVVKTNLTETGVHPLNAFAETGAGGYRITIRPNADTLRTISGAFVGGLIRLVGTDRVTINGSFNGTGKFLRIENTSATSGTAGIQIISLGENAGSNNIEISNSIILAGTTANAIPIHIGGATIPYAPGASNNKIKILNNTIMRGSVGIYSGSVAGFENDSLLIEGNTIGSDVPAENIRLYGMAIEVNKNATINKNIIKNIINTAAQQAWGIAVYDGFLNGRITNNKIEKVSSGSGAFGGRGIEIISGKANDNITVANNFIANLTGGGSTNLNTTANVGISTIATGGVKIYYNSISLSGNASISTGAVPHISAALHIGAGSRLMDIRNNSFYNTQVNPSDTSYAYSMYSDVTDTAFTIFNNNNFYASGAQGRLGYLNGNLLTLASIATATNQNANSVNLNPNYLTDIDLHAQGISLYQKGTPIAGITTDIDGESRSATLPCIGADEFLPPNAEIELIDILYPKGGVVCGVTSDSIVIVIQNLGLQTQTNVNVGAIISGAINTTINNNRTISLPPNSKDTVTISYYNSTVATGAISIKAYAKVNNDIESGNDTLSINTTVYAIPANPTVSILAGACSGGPATLFANTPASVEWYASAVGGLTLSKNDTFVTPAITSATTYYAQATTSTVQNYTAGLPAQLAGTSGAGTTNFGIVFDVLSPITLNKVTVYPVATTAGTAGTVTIDVINSANVVVHTATVNVVGYPSASASSFPQEVTLNFNLLPGTNYKIRPGLRSSGITGLLFEPSATAPGGNYGYPMVVPGILSITTSTLTAAPTNTARNDLFYYFYNWKLSAGQAGCPSDRIAVTVVPTSGPAGSGVLQSTPFDGVFNAGTISNADAACVGDVLTYSLAVPNGFNLAGLGTTWNILNPVVKTTGGATPVGTISMSGLSLQYTASAGDVDSTLVFTASIRNLSTGCDTIIKRYLTVFGKPSVNLGANQNICTGTITTLDAGNVGATYLWNTGATTQTIDVSTAGVYIVMVTNAAGCDSRDTIEVTTTQSPVVNLGADLSACVGTVVTLDAGNLGSTYLWNTGATTQTIQANASGIYMVAVSNGGCTDMDTIQVNFNALPVVDIGTDRDICTSDTITLDAGNVGSTYLWSTGATTQTIRVNLAGTYSVTVTNGNGCTKADEMVVTNKPVPVSTYTVQSANGQSVTFQADVTAGLQFSWNFGDPTSPANTSQLANPTHVFTTPGTYNVTLSVTNVATGCVSTTVTPVVVTGLGNDFAEVFKLSAAPNPFVGNTMINFVLPENANNVSIEVYDMIGRKVSSIKESGSMTAGAYKLNYKNEDLQTSSGVYMVRLNVDGNIAYIRIVDIAKQ